MPGFRFLRAAAASLLCLAGCSDQRAAEERGRARFREVERHYREELGRAIGGGATPAPTPAAVPTAVATAPPSGGPTPVVFAGAGAATAPGGASPAAAAPPTATASPSAAPVAAAGPAAPVRPAVVAAPTSTPSPPATPAASPPRAAAATPSAAGPRTGQEVEAPDSDSEPPRLVGIEFSPPQAGDGADVQVFVAATDNLSGLASGSGSLAAPAGKVYIPFALVHDPAAGRLAGAFKIPPESQPGAWRLSTLTLVDRAQNTAVLHATENPVVAAARLVVSSSRADPDPPVLESILPETPQVEDGGTVRFSIRASDASAIASVRGILANPSRNVQLNFYPKLNAATGAFEGSLALPRHSEFGEWAVTLLTITDAAGNRLTIPADDERLRGARVTVASSAADHDPPQLVALRLLQSRVQNGTSLDIEVSATDDVSGVKSADGWVVSPNSRARIHFQLRAGSTPGEFQGKAPIPAQAAQGTWKVERLTLTDAAGHRTMLTAADPALAGATFEVY